MKGKTVIRVAPLVFITAAAFAAEKQRGVSAEASQQIVPASELRHPATAPTAGGHLGRRATFATYDIAKFMSKEQLAEMGIQKLTDQERKRLSQFIYVAMSGGTVAESAKRHLESDGWEEIEVTRVRGNRATATDGVTKYRLKAIGVLDIEPGTHLGKLGPGLSEVINYDGESIDLESEEIEE